MNNANKAFAGLIRKRAAIYPSRPSVQIGHTSFHLASALCMDVLLDSTEMPSKERVRNAILVVWNVWDLKANSVLGVTKHTHLL